MAFAELLGACGVDVAAEGPAQEGFPCAVFPAQLRVRLCQKLNLDRSALHGFLGALEAAVQTPLFLQRSLQPLVLPETHLAHRRARGESLAKVLLCCDDVQERLVALLLEQLPLLADEASMDDERSLALPRLLLKQLRWLEHLVNSAALAQKLLDCLQVCPPAIQKEIIFCLPDVVADQDHELLVAPLKDLQQAEDSLLVPILDTYSNLALPDDTLGIIVCEALALLEATTPENLPVLVRFLLLTCTANNLDRVVEGLRNALKTSLDETALEAGDAYNAGFTQEAAAYGERPAPSRGTDGRVAASFGALTLDALRHGMQFKEPIAKAFLRDIDRGSKRQDHSAADVWILVVLFSITQHAKRAAQIFRQKVLKSHFTDALIIEAVRDRSSVLSLLFADLLRLCGTMLQAREHFARRCGVYLYAAIFREFREPFERGEVVPALTQHCGSGDTRQCDAALEVLLKIAAPMQNGAKNTLADGLKPYAMFVRGLLDYIHYLEDRQVRSIFQVLCFLYVGGAEDQAADVASMDEVHIIIRKQLAHASLDFKRVGIIGAVAYIAALGQQRFDASTAPDTPVEIPDGRTEGPPPSGAKRDASSGSVNTEVMTEESTQSQRHRNPDEILSGGSLGFSQTGQDARELHADEPRRGAIMGTLSLVSRSCRESPAALGFLFDELTLAVATQHLGIRVIQGVKDNYATMLEDQFLDDYSPDTADAPQPPLPDLVNVRPQLFFNLDDHDASVFVPFLHCVASPDPNVERKAAFACPLLRFVAACLQREEHVFGLASATQAMDGSAEALVVLMGCPLQLASTDTIEDFRSLSLVEKQVVATAHWLAANWIRELLNVFAASGDLLVQTKLLCRFQHLCQLQRDLLTMMKVDARCLPVLACSLARKAQALPLHLRGKKKATAPPGSVPTTLPARFTPAGSSPAQADAKLLQLLEETYRPLRHEVLLCLSLRERVHRGLGEGGDSAAVLEKAGAEVRAAAVDVDAAMPTEAIELLLRELLAHLGRSLHPSSKGASFAGSARKVLRQDDSHSSASVTRQRAGSSSSSPVPEKDLVRLSALMMQVPPPELPASSALDLMQLLQTKGVFSALRRVLDHLSELLLENEAAGDPHDLGDLLVEDLDDLDRWMPCLDLCMESISAVCRSRELWASDEGRHAIERMLCQFAEGAGNPLHDEDEDDERLSCFAPCYEDAFLLFHRIADGVRSAAQAALLLGTLRELADAGLRDAAERQGAADPEWLRQPELVALHNLASDDAMDYLRRDWAAGNPKFRYKASDLGFFVTTHLELASDPLAAARFLCLEVLPLLTTTPRCEGPAEGFPSLTAVSFVHFHGALLACVTRCWRNTDFRGSGGAAPEELVRRARSLAQLFRFLVALTKNNKPLERCGILRELLKQARPFVEAFAGTLGIFEQWCREDEEAMADSVNALFKPLQTATRHLQSVCAHAKQIRNAQLTREVPAMKKALEGLIYRTKVFAMALGRRVQVSNLKSRDIDGMEVDINDEDVSSENDDPEEEQEGASAEESGDDGVEESRELEGERQEDDVDEGRAKEEDMDEYCADLLATEEDEQAEGSDAEGSTNDENLPPRRTKPKSAKGKRGRLRKGPAKPGLAFAAEEAEGDSDDAEGEDGGAGDEGGSCARGGACKNAVLAKSVHAQGASRPPVGEGDAWYNSQGLRSF